jgi:hypothetical protein
LKTAILAACVVSFLALPALANPQKSHGLSTGCWRNGQITRLRIGWTPMGGSCPAGTQTVQMPLNDVPNMRTREFNVRVPASPEVAPGSHGHVELLKIEGFVVEAECFWDGGSDTDVNLQIFDPWGMPSVETAVFIYTDPELAAQVGKPVGTGAVVSIEHATQYLNSADSHCYFAGSVRVSYSDEALSLEEWSVLEDGWNAQ